MYVEIDVAQLAQRLADTPNTVLIDVREPDEYREAHVPGAQLVPLGEVPERVEELRAISGPIVMICRSGGRSGRACEFLDAMGLEVINVAGGTGSWVVSGRPVVTGDAPE